MFYLLQHSTQLGLLWKTNAELFPSYSYCYHLAVGIGNSPLPSFHVE